MNKVMWGLLAWLGLSVPVGLLVSKVLKARLAEQAVLDPLEHPALRGEMGLTELTDSVGLQGLAGPRAR